MIKLRQEGKKVKNDENNDSLGDNQAEWEEHREEQRELHEEIGKEEERERKLNPLQKMWEGAAEKKQSDLQAMQCYGIQRWSSAIEIL